MLNAVLSFVAWPFEYMVDVSVRAYERQFIWDCGTNETGADDSLTVKYDTKNMIRYGKYSYKPSYNLVQQTLAVGV